LIVFFYSLFSHFIRENRLENQVEVYFCDVGQGDATLIQSGQLQMLVDAGPDATVLDCLEEVMPKGDKKVEIAVLTHADNDHFKGFTSVLNNYLVEEMWVAPFSKESSDFDDFRAALDRQRKHFTRLRIVGQGDNFVVSDSISIQVLWPIVPPFSITETILSDESFPFYVDEKWGNDLSIVLKMTVFNKEILLTGDIEKQVEQALVAADLINKVLVLKVAHHGSKTSTSLPFLKKAQPEIAAISSGEKNQHGHPAQEIITSLEKRGAVIVRTDQLSTFGLLFEKEGGVEMITKEKRGNENSFLGSSMFGMFLLRGL
jgi:competence protein ComEC